MRVLVTGAGGFVGQHLLPAMRDSGMEPIPSDRELDVRDTPLLSAAIEKAKPGAIVHLAALSSVADSWRDPAACFRVNFLGTRSLLAALERCAPRARLLLVGSADEYETTRPEAAPYDETAGLRPRSPYARTKAAGELLGHLAAGRGLDVVRVRSFNHTGAGQSDRFVTSSFARQVAMIEAGLQEPVMRVGNLDSVRDFLDVDDVVTAYLRLLDPAVPAGVYNVASGRPVEVRTLLTLLLELAGVEARIEMAPEFYRPTDQLVGDAARLREATGWEPRIPLRTTLSALLDYWRGEIRREADASA
jgi:GDP-4-dehydro-6-deoxy-D-mannose reductase